MTARNVADMLALAHVGWAKAAETNDLRLRARSLELAGHALAHPDASTFFAGLQVALAETHGDLTEDDPLPDQRDIKDGGANGASPVDAGALPHDGLVTKADERHARALEPKEPEVSSVLRTALRNLVGR